MLYIFTGNECCRTFYGPLQSLHRETYDLISNQPSLIFRWKCDLTDDIKNNVKIILLPRNVFLCTCVTCWDVAVYVPHMSILYGDLTEEEKKEALEKASTLDSSLDGLNFRINRVELWITDADVRSWVKVDEHDLIS